MFRIEERRSPNILVTGGAGFIGANLTAHLLATTDARVTILDNLSHPGAQLNLEWLRAQAGAHRLSFVRGDVRSAGSSMKVVKAADEIYHLAARCEGGAESRGDFDVNVTGTIHLLEAARRSLRRPAVIYVSTAKVYGALGSLQVRPHEGCYQAADPKFRGVSETVPASISSSYDCSRGAAEQYVLDYARFYEVPAVALRVDTVAGPRQFAYHGHGWVSHLVYSILSGHPVTIYGNGMQVHDVMDVADMVEAMLAARAYIGVARGRAYNVGGGCGHAISVNQMVALIEEICHRSAVVRRERTRPGDRPFYYADTLAFETTTGWRVRHSLEQTVRGVAAFWQAILRQSGSEKVEARRATASFTKAA
jgi:CDP-paratose 2-epimerase